MAPRSWRSRLGIGMAVALAAWLPMSVAGAATVLIEGFEAPTLPAGWTVTGDAGTSLAAGALVPTEGTRLARMTTDTGASTAAFGGTTGTTLTSTTFVVAGSSRLCLDVNFLTNEFTPDTFFNDFAFSQLRDSGTNAVIATLFAADTFWPTPDNTRHPQSPATVSPGVELNAAQTDFVPAPASGFAEMTDWVTACFPAPAGLYRLFFVVSNEGDTDVSSALAIDNIRLVDAVCPALPTIVGTAGNDLLTGTPGADVIAGLGGNDRISGGGGSDILCGGPGDDLLRGDDGTDQLFGDTGNDKLVGGAGNDDLFGGAGNDDLDGSGGTNTNDGGPGADSCSNPGPPTATNCNP